MVCVEEARRQGLPPAWVGPWGDPEQKQSQVPRDGEFVRREAFTGVQSLSPHKDSFTRST